MKTIYHVISTLGLTVSMLGWTAAHACSPSYMVMTGEQNYQALKPSSHSSWLDPELSIGLVYAKKKKSRNRDVFTEYANDPAKKPFVKIKFKLIAAISEDYVVDEAKWFPKIDARGKARELQRKGAARPFAFWDRRGLSTPLVQGYSIGTSCGPMPSPTLLPDEYYLHFKKGGRTIGFEIVAGPDDPLVRTFTETLRGSGETHIRRAPNDYFKDMSGYQDFVIQTCPSDAEIEVLRWGSYSGPNPPDVVDGHIRLGQESEYDSQSKDLKLIDFLSYQRHIHGPTWQCRAGKRYLVLDKISSPPSGEIGMFFVSPPQHRYLDVVGGHIDTQDILSHISILPDETGRTRIEVEHVKRWIREANP